MSPLGAGDKQSAGGNIMINIMEEGRHTSSVNTLPYSRTRYVINMNNNNSNNNNNYYTGLSQL